MPFDLLSVNGEISGTNTTDISAETYQKQMGSLGACRSSVLSKKVL